jgi:hypothetical protein
LNFDSEDVTRILTLRSQNSSDVRVTAALRFLLFFPSVSKGGRMK